MKLKDALIDDPTVEIDPENETTDENDHEDDHVNPDIAIDAAIVKIQSFHQ